MPRIDTIVVHAGPQGPTGATGTNIYVQPGDPGSVPDGTLWLDTDDTTPDTSLNWGNIAGTLSNQTDLNTALNSKTTLPTQGGNAGKVLQTDGTNVSWQTVATGIPTGGAAGQALIKNSATNGDVGWGTFGRSFGWPDSYYATTMSHGPGADVVTGTVALTAGVLVIVPLDLPVSKVCTNMQLQVTTAAVTGGTIRMGLFTYDFTTATLIGDAGTQASDTTGVKIWTGLSITNPVGICWLGILPDQNVTVNGFHAGRGWGGAATTQTNNTWRRKTGVTPGPFAATYTTFVDQDNGNSPLLAIGKF